MTRSRIRTRAALALGTSSVMVVAATVVPVAAASAQQPFIAGSGRADARIARVGPSAGQLSLAPSVGLVLADYRGTVARAEARAIDYAALEDSVRSLEEDIGEPLVTEELYPNVRAESTGERRNTGENPPFSQTARASEQPEGRATVVLGAFEIPGVVRVGGGRAESFAGLAQTENGKIRHAGGTVVVGRVEVGDGAVILRDLRWHVVQITNRNNDPTPTVQGGFVIGSATIGGETHEGPVRGADLGPLFDEINAALAPSGLLLAAPRVQKSDGVARITPLGVRMVDSEIGKALIAPAVGGAQPAREQIVGPFLEECPQCAPIVLLADVTVGVFSGANRFDLDIGGAFGFTEGDTFANPFAARFGSFGTTPPRQVTTFEEERSRGAPFSTTEGPVVEQRRGRDVAAPPVPVPRGDGGTDSPSWLWALAVLGALTALAVGLAQHRRIRAAHRAALVGGGS